MFLFRRPEPKNSGLTTSQLFDESTFYEAFIRDLSDCREEVIIESPYITSHRMKTLSPVINNLLKHNIAVYVITRDPSEHNAEMARQAEVEIHTFECSGVQVLICKGNHHRKLAVLDRKILWEGSLNILSQVHSREFMRRIQDKDITEETLMFLNLKRHL